MALEREHAGTGIRTAATFARTLSDLKQNGCNLLVVGGDHEPTRSNACQRLLGYGGTEPRRRIVVAADTSVEAVHDRLPTDSVSPSDNQDTIIDWQTPVRSISASTGADSSSVRTITVGADDLTQLGIEIHERIVDGLEYEPGQLRLCFDSLVPLVSRYDTETVFRFLHLVTGSLDRSRAMGHYHLPVSRNAESVRTLEPLFDAVVELRTETGRPQQRWHIPEEALTTDWLSV